MTTLVPMQAEAFPAFFELAVAGYADDNVASGRWLEHEAVQLAQSETQRLLPQGVATPDHYLYEIKGESSADPVGFLWFAALPRGSRRVAYLFQLHVHSPFRRRGHARAALAALEQLAIGLGLAGVALNVFGSNVEAQALYRAAGYGVTSIGMHKDLPLDVA
jgi:ribosomal protein S18 acetylase RimI-like enzyme